MLDKKDASTLSPEEKRFVETLDELDEMATKLYYVQGERDGMLRVITMVLCAAIVVALIRRIYGPTE